MKRYGYLIQEIIERNNLEESFDEVTRDLKNWSKKHFESQKEQIIKILAESIGNGSFRITRFEEFEVKDGPKNQEGAVTSSRGAHRLQCRDAHRGEVCISDSHPYKLRKHQGTWYAQAIPKGKE